MMGTPDWYETTGMGWATLRGESCELPGFPRTTTRCYRTANHARALAARCLLIEGRTCNIRGDAGRQYCCPADPGPVRPAAAAEVHQEPAEKEPSEGWAGLFTHPTELAVAAGQAAKDAAGAVIGEREEVPGERPPSIVPYVVLGGAILGVGGLVWWLLRRDRVPPPRYSAQYSRGRP